MVFVFPYPCYVGPFPAGDAEQRPVLWKWGVNSLVCFACVTFPLLVKLSLYQQMSFLTFTLQFSHSSHQWEVSEGWGASWGWTMTAREEHLNTFASNHFSREKFDACHKNYFITELNLAQEYTFQEKNNAIRAAFNLWSNLATYQE